MRPLIISSVLITLAACATPEAPQSRATVSPIAASTAINQTATSSLCSQYGSSWTDTLTRQMIEAELVVRGVTRCGGANLGPRTAAQFRTARYSRSAATTVPRKDFNCSDFGSGASAQRFFLAAGGPVSDPHNLDGDGDGLACEWGAQIRQVASTRRVVSRPRFSGSRCYTGSRGGTYTITSGGNRNYSGC